MSRSYPCPYCDDSSGGIAGEEARRHREGGTIVQCPSCLGSGRMRALPDYAEALWSDLYSQMQTVYWNVNQQEYSYFDLAEFDIPGVTFRNYYWGEEPYPHALPEFVCDARPDVVIRFYKWPGRGMETNADLTPEEWVKWYRDCAEVIAAADPSFGPPRANEEGPERERMRWADDGGDA